MCEEDRRNYTPQEWLLPLPGQSWLLEKSLKRAGENKRWKWTFNKKKNLVPHLKIKALSFSPFSVDLAVDVLCMSLIMLRCNFSVFNPKGMLDFLRKAFFCIYCNDHLVFYILLVCSSLYTHLYSLTHACTSQTDPTRSRRIIFLPCGWIQLVFRWGPPESLSATCWNFPSTSSCSGRM